MKSLLLLLLTTSLACGQTMTVSGSASTRTTKRLPVPCKDYGFQGNHADRFVANATVYTVSNLNASGAGSYLQAVEDANNDGTPSIIKFTVSGRIDLLVNVSVYGRLFVDGTTAPDPGICISGGMHFLQRTNFTEPSDNVFFQDIAFYPSTRFSGGIIDDFVDQGGGLWKSTNPVFARVQLVEFVFEGDHPGAYTNGPPGNLITQAGSYPPAAGQAYLDAAADEFWVAEGGNISTDPNSDPIIIKLLKTNHPNAAQVLDVENVVFLRCTFARTTDIAVLADNVRNFAMVDCIIADPIAHTYHQKGPHSKGPLFKVDDTDEPLWSNNILVYRNLAMHGRERMPCRFADAEGWIINNVGYGMVAGFEIATRDTDIPGWQQSVVGNYLIEATNTAERVPDIVIEPSGNGSVYLDATNYWGGQVRTSPWVEGAAPNYLDHRNALSDNNSDVDAGDRLSAPHDQLPLGLTPTSAADAYTYVTTGLVGARYDRDYWQGEVANFDGTTQIKCDWRTYRPFVHMQEVLSDGVTLRLHFSESMTAGAGGTGGMTLYNYTATYSSGSGTDTWDYTITGGPIGKGVDGLATTYLQPGDGIETTTGGTDVQRWIRYIVNNNSTQ